MWPCKYQLCDAAIPSGLHSLLRLKFQVSCRDVVSVGSDVALEPAGCRSLDGDDDEELEGVYALSDSGGPRFGNTHKSGSLTSSMSS
jgi:hypothetical protein